MKKDFIVRRSITMIEGRPHVETYSEQELVRCKDCKYYKPSNPAVGCRKVVRGENADQNWFCADGERDSFIKKERMQMSRYGEDGSTGYAKEGLYDEMEAFLEEHTVYELLEILADVIRCQANS